MTEPETALENTQQFDPDRLAGREYKVKLEYTVEFVATVIAGPEEWHSIEEARKIAYPTGPLDPVDWELVHKDVDSIRDIWMDDPEAPKAASWLKEPNVPSEETYWDDTQHFGEAADS